MKKMRLVLSDSFFTLHAQRAKYRYDMDIIWIIVGAICLLVGLAGCFLPALPGPPLSYVGMILLHLTDKVQFTATQLIVWAILVIIVQVLDYLTPLIGTKYSGGSKWGNRGCIAGTVIGIFLFPPWGIIFRSSRGSRHWRTVGWQTYTRSSQSRAGRFCRISLGGNFKGIALRLFRGCLHFCSILISFLSFLRRKTEKFFFERYDDGSVDSSWGLSLYISTPLLRNGCFFDFSPIASLHPAMLRGTARERLMPGLLLSLFFQPLRPSDTSPIFCVAKHRGGGLMPFVALSWRMIWIAFLFLPPLQFFIEDRGYSSGLLHSKLICRTLLSPCRYFLTLPSLCAPSSIVWLCYTL